MNALVKKEIRLLLPGWAIGLAAVCLGYFWADHQHSTSWFRVYGLFAFPFLLGPAMVLMMTLSSFGHELSAGTFSLLLAQPISRRRIWLTKTVLLAGAVVSVWTVWWLALILNQNAPLFPEDFRDLMVTTILFLLAVYSGGLCSVLLLRQVGAAFWFTLIVPSALAFLTAYCSEKFGQEIHTERNLTLVLATYSVGSFFWARQMFLRAQDVQWTGGDIALPAWIRSPQFFAPSGKMVGRHPRRALFVKELQLHQSQFIIAGVLLMLHLGMIATRKLGDGFTDSPTMEFVTSWFWAFWLVMPLLIGCVSVAEERKLGTLEAQLCLPVRRRTQLVIKFAAAAALSVFLGVVMPLLLEGSRILPDLWTRLATLSIELPVAFLRFCLIAIGICAISFHVSTMVRNTLQAVGPAIAGILIAWTLLMGAPAIDELVGYPLWHGRLIYVIGVPVLTATLAGLAYWNFKRVLVGWPVWRRNLVVILAALVLVMATTTAIYQRAWELAEKLEPPHGPARLQASDIVSVTDRGFGPAIQFADGRSWSCQLYFQQGGWLTSLVNDWTVKEAPGGGFLAGTNWSSVWYSSRDVVALQRDGSLWVSENPGPSGTWIDGMPAKQEATTLVRYGDESDWKNLVGSWSSAYLLKRDGTLWQLGPKTFDSKIKWPGLRAFTPKRLGNDADWAEIFTLNARTVFRKTDGRVYVYPAVNTRQGETITLEEGLTLAHSPELERDHWRDLIWAWSPQSSSFQLGVAADGTFRVAAVFQPDLKGQYQLVAQDALLNPETNWLAAVQAPSSYRAAHVSAVTLKSDGTLWAWNFPDNPLEKPQSAQATRLGTHSDWVGISHSAGGIVSLAADGGLWFWRFPGGNGSEDIQPLIRPSRKPQLLGNIFDQAE